MTAVAFRSGRGRGWAYAAYALLFLETAALAFVFVQNLAIRPSTATRSAGGLFLESLPVLIAVTGVLVLGLYGWIARGRALIQPEDRPRWSAPDRLS